MKTSEKKALIQAVSRKMRITKVICTRSVKGRGGDHYVGFASAWDTVQDDGGHGLADATDGTTDSGMTLKEAKIAAYLLGMQADQTAFENAAAGSLLTKAQADNACAAIKNNYNALMNQLLGGEE